MLVRSTPRSLNCFSSRVPAFQTHMRTLPPRVDSIASFSPLGDHCGDHQPEPSLAPSVMMMGCWRESSWTHTSPPALPQRNSHLKLPRVFWARTRVNASLRPSADHA